MTLIVIKGLITLIKSLLGTKLGTTSAIGKHNKYIFRISLNIQYIQLYTVKIQFMYIIIYK